MPVDLVQGLAVRGRFTEFAAGLYPIRISQILGHHHEVHSSDQQAGQLCHASAPTDFQTLRTEEPFKQLKPGDEIVSVCNQFQTVTVKTIASTTEAMPSEQFDGRSV